MEKEDLRLIKSKNSKKIHTPGCIAVRMMKKENRVFLQLKDLGGGLIPCKWCNAEHTQAVFTRR